MAGGVPLRFLAGCTTFFVHRISGTHSGPKASGCNLLDRSRLSHCGYRLAFGGSDKLLRDLLVAGCEFFFDGGRSGSRPLLDNGFPVNGCDGALRTRALAHGCGLSFAQALTTLDDGVNSVVGVYLGALEDDARSLLLLLGVELLNPIAVLKAQVGVERSISKRLLDNRDGSLDLFARGLN